MTKDQAHDSGRSSPDRILDPQEWERRVADARKRRERAIAERKAKQAAESGEGKTGGARIIGFDPTTQRVTDEAGRPVESPHGDAARPREDHPARPASVVAAREDLADRLTKVNRMARSQGAGSISAREAPRSETPEPRRTETSRTETRRTETSRAEMPPRPAEPDHAPEHDVDLPFEKPSRIEHGDPGPVLRAPAGPAFPGADPGHSARAATHVPTPPSRGRSRSRSRWDQNKAVAIAVLVVLALLGGIYAYTLLPGQDPAQLPAPEETATGETAAPEEVAEAEPLSPASGNISDSAEELNAPEPETLARLDLPDAPVAPGDAIAEPRNLPAETTELAAARPEQPTDFASPDAPTSDTLPSAPVAIEPPQPPAQPVEETETAAEPEAPAAEETEEADTTVLPTSAIRVYIHAPVTVAQDRIDATSAALEAVGYSVQSVSRINLSVSSSNVRYFFGGDVDHANAIGSALRGLFPEGPYVRDFTFLDTLATNGHIEVWLSGTARASSNTGQTPQPTQPVSNPVPTVQQPAQPPAASAPAPTNPNAVDPNRLRSLVETAQDP
ncbi:hypothetical protein [Amaricoccus macauensis]|uniref:hypothetical protein n=1 Tax=Amaricoccus macauensis TaxID=57001 RepID=UPI003C7B08AF